MRFGAKTQYCLLDIDRNSAYHPSRDPLAIGRIAAALEPLGLANHLTCTSSYSGGLHLYFPFTIAQNSWELAIAIAAQLETSGFKTSPGQLELFPDPKPYRVEQTPSLFNAHRLPMQAGSYLVDSDCQPVWSDSERFVSQWQAVQIQNAVDKAVLKRIIKQAKRHCYSISGKANKFINDLNAEIEVGWTDAGQTNYLLGRITMRAYIFGHMLTGCPPLEGELLVAEIVNTAQSLPGYRDWCNHQHEIEHRSIEWANCIQNSHYFHYGDKKGKYKDKVEQSNLKPAAAGLPSWNQQQSELARDRIKVAIAGLLERDSLPARATARFKALVKSGIGGGSLYKHRDLWHPDHFGCFEQVDLNRQPESSRGNPDIIHNSQTSLLYEAGGDNALGKGSDDLITDFELSGGNNSDETMITPQDWQAVQAAAVTEAKASAQQIRAEAQQQAHLARIQCYLDSGDPILIAEALAWLMVAQPAAQSRPDD